MTVVWKSIRAFIATVLTLQVLLFTFEYFFRKDAFLNVRQKFIFDGEHQVAAEPTLFIMRFKNKKWFVESNAEAYQIINQWLESFEKKVREPSLSSFNKVQVSTLKSDLGIALYFSAEGTFDVAFKDVQKLPSAIDLALENEVTDLELVVQKLSSAESARASERAHALARAEAEQAAKSFSEAWNIPLEPCEGIERRSVIVPAGEPIVSGGLTQRDTIVQVKSFPISQFIRPLSTLVHAEAPDLRPVSVPLALPLQPIQIWEKTSLIYCRRD